MSFKSKAATAGIAFSALWGVWQVAQAENTTPGSTDQRTTNLIDLAGDTADQIPNALSRIVVQPGTKLAGEVGNVAGQVGDAGKAVGGAVTTTGVPAPPAGG